MIVPVYGRSDLIRYQLALFANDTAFKSGSIELIYFIDDPRLIDDTLQLCEGWSSLSRVPMLLAYTGENHGFSGANNLAASVARGDFLVLLNSDVMPKRPGWVHQLDAGACRSPRLWRARCKAPLSRRIACSMTAWCSSDFPFWNGLYGNNHPGKGLPNWSELDAPPREVEGVTGACLGIARGLFAKLGGLCEDFVFGDFEDSELCLRVRNAGKRVYYAPGVELYHLERQSQSLLPDGESWRWQLTVYNAWLQDKRWRAEIDALKRAVKRCAINQIHHNMYKDCLFNLSKSEKLSFDTIKVGKDHTVFTETIEKDGIVPFDDKKYYIDQFTSYSYGHWRIREYEENADKDNIVTI